MMRKQPEFKSEKEEAEFWDTHDSTEYFDELEELGEVFIDSRPPKKTNFPEA